jgi:hypothetical protein
MTTDPEAEHEKLSQFWSKVTQMVLERSDRFGPLIQSLRAAVPMAWDGDTLIIGLSGVHAYLSGHLEAAANRHRVREVMKELTRRDVDYHLIEGTTLEDWEVVKKKEEIQRQKVEKRSAPQPVEAPVGSAPVEEALPAGAWANFQQKLHFAWQLLGTRRTMPVARAEFLQEAIAIVSKAEAEAAAAGESEENMERLVTRAIERIAGMVDIPATAVALELIRSRRKMPEHKPPERPKKKQK